MLAPNVIALIILLSISLLALFGDTSKNQKLNHLGKTAFALIVLVFLINLYLTIQENNNNKNRELKVVKARNTILTRINQDIEGFRHLFLWKEHRLLPLEPHDIDFDAETSASTFMDFSKNVSTQHKNKILSRFNSLMESIKPSNNPSYRFLEFKESDRINSFVKIMEKTGFSKVVRNYNFDKDEFSEHLIKNNLPLNRIKIIFLHLESLDEEIKNSIRLNKKRLYELSPECKNLKSFELFDHCYG